MSRRKWNIALKVMKAKPGTLPLAELVQHLAALSALLGDEGAPVFTGVTAGSAVVGVALDEGRLGGAIARIDRLASDNGSEEFAQLLGRLKASADNTRRTLRLVTRERTLLEVQPAPKPATPETIVHDRVDIDGVVYRISGKDSTISIGLLETGTGRSISVETTNSQLARSFAAHFKGGPIRVATEGTWRREGPGLWQPHRLRALEFSVLDEAPASEVMQTLRGLAGNEWTTLADPMAFWRDLRGIDA